MAGKVKRPTSVKVLTIEYNIRWLDEDEWYGERMDPDALAMTERDKALVSMRADGTAHEDSMRATLLHELLHCCTQATRLDRYITQVDDAEEFFIGQMSPVLMSLLNDNPDVVAYLLSVGPVE